MRAQLMILALLLPACFDDEALEVHTCASSGDCVTPAVCLEGFCVRRAAADASPRDLGFTDGVPIDGAADATSSDQGVTDAQPDDASEGDGGTIPCAANIPFCDPDGRTLHICNGEGTGPQPGMDHRCGFLCHAGACRYASNVPDSTFDACDSSAPILAPPAENGSIRHVGTGVSCAPHCGDGSTTFIPATGTLPAVICVSSFTLASGLTFDADPTSPALVVLVAGSAVIDGTINFAGRNGSRSSPASGGPGGAPGAPPPARSGLGPGGGGAGTNTSDGTGGAGGSHGGLGGSGGAGLVSGTSTAGAIYGNLNLVPLAGGSGGGSSMVGGGGGGGALQISARGSITATGRLDASGGDGSSSDSPSGGGGSGGSLLLEAPSLSVTGTLDVTGGNGGSEEDGGRGGNGAQGMSLNGSAGGRSTGGGGGGGGGGGRVRLNAGLGASCTTSTPLGSCTIGSLRATP